jgi:hypothetical protein
MRRQILVACILCCLAAALTIQPGHARTAQNTQTLVGSWQLTLVPNVPPGDPPTIAIPGLATFTSDETAIATAGGVIVGPVSSSTVSNGVTPAHGIWQPSPAVGRFFIKLIGLVTNANGSLQATRTFTTTVAPNAAGDQFSGAYTLEIVEGNIVVISTGTVTGQLIPHPLLP